MTKLFLIAATMLSAATSPVIAREARPAATAAEATQAVDSARVDSPAQKYCVINQVTGSRIPIKTCQTRKDWMAEGFDPLAKR